MDRRFIPLEAVIWMIGTGAVTCILGVLFGFLFLGAAGQLERTTYGVMIVFAIAGHLIIVAVCCWMPRNYYPEDMLIGLLAIAITFAAIGTPTFLACRLVSRAKSLPHDGRVLAEKSRVGEPEVHGEHGKGNDGVPSS
jgi:hypothetical protein